MEKKATRAAYGDALVELGKTNDKIVVLDADLANATKTDTFKKAFPDRFFDFGIAENNLICAATGMAHSGLIPFASTFAVFGAGRAFEMIRNSVAYVKANVKLCFTHSGLSVGEDGGSHQSIEDLSLMRVLPNMTIFSPCDYNEAKKAVFEAAKINGPVYVRLGRPNVEVITKENDEFIPGKANVMKDGDDIAIIATGHMVQESLHAAQTLKEQGISAAVINMHTIKPLDKDIILKYALKCKAIVTAEEHSIIGGLGSAVAEVLAENNTNIKFLRIGINDKFGKSGSPAELFEEYGISSSCIAKKCLGLIK